MQAFNRLKHHGVGILTQCCQCSRKLSRYVHKFPRDELLKLLRFIQTAQTKSSCLSCEDSVMRNSLSTLQGKTILSDESMAGILGSHHVHGTRQVRCYQRPYRRYLSLTPKMISASPYDARMKDYLGDLMTNAATWQVMQSSGYYPAGNGEFSTDLKRFLSEVGTDPREARYWLKQFINLDANKPFAVIQVGNDVFNHTHELENLVSCISFLQRNQMRPIVIHGNHVSKDNVITPDELRTHRSKLLGECMLLTSMLEAYGTHARPLFSGCTLIQAHQFGQSSLSGTASTINSDPIKWCLQTRHVPIIPAVGETQSGQILLLDIWSVTEAIAVLLQPLKVMEINTVGGFTDEDGHVIANVNLPTDEVNMTEKPWCTPDKLYQIQRITRLLEKMPSQSSVVLTSVDKMLQELFTHHGSGTFFKITEPVRKCTSLSEVDVSRLTQLLTRSFGKELKEDYVEKIEKSFHTLYLSEGYNAAALITTEGLKVPYLDKFAVSMKAQGEGTGEMVWECVRKEFPQLFWRSKGDNPINPWYFKKSEGSWSDGKWTVFWYGVGEHHLSSELIDYALRLESSFVD
ncbi:N-acetylglutamate synthase, mitochondrial-like [Liolophura sinensis]|uniref:N-acetylglutamate synthase, mitochondrial-like n=1 Tax=Liolophura sinensis TaxID=3198878 RepID=UPI0031595A6A